MPPLWKQSQSIFEMLPSSPAFEAVPSKVPGLPARGGQIWEATAPVFEKLLHATLWAWDWGLGRQMRRTQPVSLELRGEKPGGAEFHSRVSVDGLWKQGCWWGGASVSGELGFGGQLGVHQEKEGRSRGGKPRPGRSTT